MNEQQEYIKFWASILEKLNDVQKDYNSLSGTNKQRVDSVRNAVLHAHSYAEAVQIMCEQTK